MFKNSKNSRPSASDRAFIATFPLHHSTMLAALLRRNMSQKLSMLLLAFGLAWGLMLLRYTVQQPRHQSSAELREKILELSRRYVKVLTEENQNAPGGPQGTSMAGYGKNLEKFRSGAILPYFLNGKYDDIAPYFTNTYMTSVSHSCKKSSLKD